MALVYLDQESLPFLCHKEVMQRIRNRYRQVRRHFVVGGVGVFRCPLVDEMVHHFLRPLLRCVVPVLLVLAVALIGVVRGVVVVFQCLGREKVTFAFNPEPT